jgi:hypothetical protein
MFSTVTGKTTGIDLAFLRHKDFQSLDILIINAAQLICAKPAKSFSYRAQRIFFLLNNLFILAKTPGFNLHVFHPRFLLTMLIHCWIPQLIPQAALEQPDLLSWLDPAHP